MKKLLLGLIAMAMITVGASADMYKMGGVKLGGASTSVNSGTSDTGLYIGVDSFLPLVVEGLAVGWGADVVSIGNSVNTQGSASNYTMAGQIKLGYSLKHLINWNVNLIAEGGYGLTHIVNTNNAGAQYGAGVNVQVYKHLSVGYQYKSIDTGFAGLDNLDTHIGYAQWSWQ